MAAVYRAALPPSGRSGWVAAAIARQASRTRASVTSRLVGRPSTVNGFTVVLPARARHPGSPSPGPVPAAWPGRPAAARGGGMITDGALAAGRDSGDGWAGRPARTWPRRGGCSTPARRPRSGSGRDRQPTRAASWWCLPRPRSRRRASSRTPGPGGCRLLRVGRRERRTSLTANAGCCMPGQSAFPLRSCWRRDTHRGGRSRSRRLPGAVTDGGGGANMRRARTRRSGRPGGGQDGRPGRANGYSATSRRSARHAQDCWPAARRPHLPM